MKNKLALLRAKILSRKRELAIISVIMVFITLGFLIIYQRPIVYSYGGSNCFRDVTLFPDLMKSKGSAYKVSSTNKKQLAGVALISTKTCIDSQTAPEAMAVSGTGKTLLGIPVIGKQFSVKSLDLPKMNAASIGTKIPVRDVIKINIDQPDKTFSYRLLANSKSVDCSVQDKYLECNLTPLVLSQKQEYEVKVERLYKGKTIDTALKRSFQTTDPVNIVATSFENGKVIYDIPKDFTVDASKELKSADISLVGPDGKQIASKVTISGVKATVAPDKPLERRIKFKVLVNDLVAADKGVLLTPASYDMSTSGGPKVKGASIGSKSVSPSGTIKINFDQALKIDPTITKHVSVTIQGKPVVTEVIASGNTISVRPVTSLGLCTPFTIKIDSGVTSLYDISGDSAWQINSRTICYSISTIGYSVKGRPINVWTFGSGAKKILFVGGTHGDERSTKYLLDEWIKELDNNPSKIAADKTILIIPTINPDGFAANNRLNANNVDLNRNFPANDWKSNVTMPGGNGTPVVNGAGASPLSESESRILSSYVLSVRPTLVLTYHSVASVASGNNSGNSNSLASKYAAKSGYRYLPKPDTNIVFQYDTTGAFEDWLHDKYDIPAILIELGSDTKSGIDRNRPAMWMILDSV